MALAVTREIEVRRTASSPREPHDAREHRGLPEGELVDAAAEVGVRRGIDAVGSGAEVDDVEVALEDLVLGVVALDLDGQQRLLDLARERDLIVEKQPARELLRDRRGALKLLVREVGERRRERCRRNRRRDGSRSYGLRWR